MPAEWEPHESTWLVWPQNQTTWPGRLLKEVERTYVEMIRTLLPYEKVNLLVGNELERKRVIKALGVKKAKINRLFFHEVRTVDTWIRDYGPLFVIIRKAGRVNEKAFTKWVFNAWGGKYADLAQDDGTVDQITALKKMRRFNAGIVMEGGSIELNGRGTCLTTEQCLLNPNRNPGYSRAGLEDFLKQFLGVLKVIWLKEGIEGDDTDGHVDDIARFVSPTTIVTAIEGDASDRNCRILKENLHILKSASDVNGRKFRIVELSMPGKLGVGRRDADADRLPASYANFYIANHTVLIPVYSHPNDKKALRTVQKLFPQRKVVGIECTALVYGLGSIHCVTQQEPKS